MASIKVLDPLTEAVVSRIDVAFPRGLSTR